MVRWLQRPQEDGGDETDDRTAPPADGTPADVGADWQGDAPAQSRLVRTLGDQQEHATLVELDPDDLARALRRCVARALAEDLGVDGDVTSRACIPPGAHGTGVIVARAPGVLAGRDAIVEAFAQVDGRVDVDLLVADGATVHAGDRIARVEGPLRSILTGERTALNLLGHLAGIATATRRYVDAVRGTGCDVRDTRKTTPGLRLLEKAAVRTGGGVNHRIGLFDALLVKDNHVVASGGVGPATRSALERARGRPVQVEVTTRAELDAAIEAGATDLLVDNVTPGEAAQAVRFAAGRARIEVSGGVTLDTVRAYAEAGVDAISVGALTHSAPRLDIALDLDPATVAGLAPGADEMPDQDVDGDDEDAGDADDAGDAGSDEGYEGDEGAAREYHLAGLVDDVEPRPQPDPGVEPAPDPVSDGTDDVEDTRQTDAGPGSAREG